MRWVMMAVFDSKVAAFGQPFFSQNVQTGVRSFVAAAGDKSLVIGKNPNDFSLFYLGDYDDSTGEIFPRHALENLGLASTFIKE